MSRNIDMERGPDVLQILQIGLLIVMAYVVAAGPVFRLSARRQIPHECIAIYRPLMTPTSPGFSLMRDYVAMWI